MLPNQAMQLTWCLACLIPLLLFGGLYFFMRRIGQVLPLWQGVLIIIFYTVVIGFLFWMFLAPMLSDLNQSLVYSRIQVDLDTQCGVGNVDVNAGQLGESNLYEWRLDSQVKCDLTSQNAQWTCTCPTSK